jgi:homoserine dehydrogenase
MRLLFIGFGTVGQGLAELLVRKKEVLLNTYGLDIQVVGIADKIKGSVTNPEGINLPDALEKASEGGDLSDLPASKFEGEALDMIKQVEADVMLEVTYTDIETGEPATSHIRKAMERGMHVVTTNKGPVALHYKELKELAEEKGVRFLFEGTVMSGTPLINFIRENLAGCDIQEIKGILNGTTNYILAKYVFEADGKPFDYPCEGITGITATSITEAKSRNKRFKLIGKVWREGSIVKASVAPEEIDLTHPLASIMGATNAVTITTDTLGDVTVVGPGAGKEATGYSMLVDLIAIGGQK